MIPVKAIVVVSLVFCGLFVARVARQRLDELRRSWRRRHQP